MARKKRSLTAQIIGLFAALQIPAQALVLEALQALHESQQPMPIPKPRAKKVGQEAVSLLEDQRALIDSLIDNQSVPPPQPAKRAVKKVEGAA